MTRSASPKSIAALTHSHTSQIGRFRLIGCGEPSVVHQLHHLKPFSTLCPKGRIPRVGQQNERRKRRSTGFDPASGRFEQLLRLKQEQSCIG